MKYSLFTLGELVTIKYGKNQKKVQSENGTIPIYGTGGFMGYATQALYNKKSVLIGRKGTINKVRFVDHPFWTVDTLFYTEVNEELVAPKYLYYLMSLLDLDSYNEGTTIPSLRTETLNRLEFYIPNLDYQNKVLSILEPIEMKIKLNNAINENLLQQAQAIFCNMFPEILSSNGETTLEQLIVFSNGKKRPQVSGNIPVYGGNGILAYTSDANAENCVIIGRVGAYCGNTFLCTGKCWVSDNAIQAKSKNSKSQLFIFYLLSNTALPSRHIGTGQPLMTQGILNAIPILLPEQSQIDLFNEIVNPIHKIIDKNNAENKFLANIRDTLLPKLMSGEIDVSNLDL